MNLKELEEIINKAFEDKKNVSDKSDSKILNAINETVDLPISFIIGVSFICGSITGSFLTINSTKKK